MDIQDLRQLIGDDIQEAIDALNRAASMLPPFNLNRGGNEDAACLRISRARAQIQVLR